MMGASPLDPEMVQRRLRAIRDELDELGRLGEVTLERLQGDWGVRKIVERVLIELVEYAAQINTHIVTANGRLPAISYKESFEAAAKVGLLPAELAARIAPSAGLRNVLVHQYLDIDMSIVADAVAMVLTDYAGYVREVADWLERQSSA